ncbi:nectin cell adhesion molecule 1b isoform X3 [Erpetoichthys calabaricus]|uniref:Nectin cell adhesion molecule 1b n=1 Tax=Erpetoichthys calabaricus TaxID=27687 RepID=A0A8C4SJ86_ERPCA|nr:nectin cell adhesion molecule 1b isoform X3 [Erpetoichthys calabaricus]
MLSSCWILVVAAILPATQTQLVQMDDRVSGMVGTDVLLTCKYSNRNPNVKITQVTWQKLLNGTKVNVAIANPTLGVSVLESFKERVMFRNPLVTQANPSLEDASIFMKQLQLSDEATYICEYATFPAGNRENQVNLTVLARPTNQVILTSPTIVAQSSQTSKMIVATCISSNGKPPSDITWETKLRGEATFHKIPNPNGTVTVRSDYWVVPSRESHRQKLTCIVSYQGEKMRQQSVTLNVQYEPQVTIEGFDGNWYLNRQDVQLTCKSDANPAVTTYQWKLLNGSMPNNVEIQNNSLFFKGPVTYELAGTYMCEATNSVGKRSEQVEVNVTEFPNNPTPRDTEAPLEQPSSGVAIGGAVGGVVLLVLASVLLFVFLRRRQRTFKGDYSTKKHVFGNGYSKAAGGLSPHPPLPQSLQYPEDSDDDKKPAPDSTTSGYGVGERDFDPSGDSLKMPYITIDERNAHGEYDERTLSFQYDPELEITDDMVSQNDGSVISKKEWYV